MRADEVATLRAWDQLSRFTVLMLLFLSSVRFLLAAIAIGTIGMSETDKLIAAGCLLFAGLAFSLGLAFRKVGAATWKHKLVVAIVTLPAALSLLQ